MSILQYRRRNSNAPTPTVTSTLHPILTYINWSYDKNRQINKETLKNILSEFKEDYTHIYLRLFNETPKQIINSFLEQEDLDPASLEQIYTTLSCRGFDLRSFS